MLVLAHIGNAEGDVFNGNDREENIRALVNTFNRFFEDEGPECDTYIHIADDIEDYECVFGYDDANAIKTNAERWNGRLLQEFQTAMTQMETIRTCSGSYPIDSTATYRLRKAVDAIDNHFYPFLDYAVLARDARRIETCLSLENKTDILAHPEEYAMFQVYVK